MALSIVTPVYNEGEKVAGLLKEITASVATRPTEILVVYDFDADTTVPVIRRMQPEMPEVQLVHNGRGPGVLNALKTGLATAGAPFVLVLMADGSDEPSCIQTMLRLAENGADLVAGSRYMKGGHQIGGPLLKRLLSRAGGLSLHWLGGIATHDPTNNFKLYSRRLLESVTIESTAGFELALELTVKAHRMGMRIAEVPTTWRDRTEGKSRFQLGKWLPHYLRWYWFGIATRFVGKQTPPAEPTRADRAA
jgi:glycosyltransferase involved in cell wall biosynthesis